MVQMLTDVPLKFLKQSLKKAGLQGTSVTTVVDTTTVTGTKLKRL
jgi:hypothetical protein